MEAEVLMVSAMRGCAVFGSELSGAAPRPSLLQSASSDGPRKKTGNSETNDF